MTDEAKIGEDEMAIKLNHSISGGLGTHEKGTVLRNLSASAFNTLSAEHTVVAPGKLASGAVDAADPAQTTLAPPAPVGKAK